MTPSSHDSASNQFVEAGGVRFAYRRFGAGNELPLLLCQHFTGTMNTWDPQVTDTLAQDRELILFDNAGVGSSGGSTPPIVQAMAEDALRFIDALSLAKIDLLGFSLGGMVAQQILLARPALVRRVVLAGTGPEGGERIDLRQPPSSAVLTDASLSADERQLRLFFAPSETSQAAGRAFQKRRARRASEGEWIPSPVVAAAQTAAIAAWGRRHASPFTQLKSIRQPALVFNGMNDVMIPTINSYLLSEHLPNARLILYPDAGHGALFQYAEEFCQHVRHFLDM